MVKAIVRIAIYWGCISLLLWTGHGPGPTWSVDAIIAYLLISPVMIAILACVSCFARLYSQPVQLTVNRKMPQVVHVGLEMVAVIALVASLSNLCQR
jgi:hypothetical protein